MDSHCEKNLKTQEPNFLPYSNISTEINEEIHTFTFIHLNSLRLIWNFSHVEDLYDIEVELCT